MVATIGVEQGVVSRVGVQKNIESAGVIISLHILVAANIKTGIEGNAGEDGRSAIGDGNIIETGQRRRIG